MTLFGSSVRLSALHHVVGAAELVGHDVDLALAAGAVAGADRAAVRDRDGGDVALGVDPQRPGLVVELLLPDADVDLGEVVDAGARARVGEHAPVVEDVGLRSRRPGDDRVPLARDGGQLGPVDRGVLAVPAHRHDLAGLRAPVQRRGVAVVARRPVALGDLVAEVARAVLARDPHQPLAAGADLVLVAVEHRADQRADVLGLRDVGLVVAAQVGDLLLVEEHRAGERGAVGPDELAQRAVRGVVVLEGPERGELGLGLGVELERRLGGDAERALVAHEQRLERVAGRALGHLRPAAVAEAHDLAGREHVDEAQHEVARVAVARADQRPAARADPAADERARVGRGVVGIDQPVLAQHLVELEHVDPGADRAGAVLEVDLVDLVEALEVEQDAVAQRHGAVGEAGAAGARDDGDAEAVGDPDDLGDLLRAAGEHDDVGQVVGPAVHGERRRARGRGACRAGLLVIRCSAPRTCGELLQRAVVDARRAATALMPASVRPPTSIPSDSASSSWMSTTSIARAVAGLGQRPLGPRAGADQRVDLQLRRMLEPPVGRSSRSARASRPGARRRRRSSRTTASRGRRRGSPGRGSRAGSRAAPPRCPCAC